MTDLLSQYHLTGVAIGLVSFLVIGLFHPIVIKCHYHFGTGCWWWFLLLGLSACAGSIAIADTFWSAVTAVVAFSSFWTIKEIFEQEQRVERGWFPANPRRAARKTDTNDRQPDLTAN